MSDAKMRCAWCGGPDGIACSPKVAVCHTCRDEVDPEVLRLGSWVRAVELREALECAEAVMKEVQP